MNIKNFYKFFYDELKNKYTTHCEIKNIFFILMKNILKCKKTDIYIKMINNYLLDDNHIKYLNSVILDLKKNKPIQYIIKKTYFMNMEYYINNKVFIPRPETEELVNLIIKNSILKNKIYILDICTGSGCIPIFLKKYNCELEIYGIDSSKEALYIANKNAEKYKLNINFYKIDILKNDIPKYFPLFDIIISNPPYVRKSEIKKMSYNVYKYEPSNAIFVSDNNPLIFYKKIILLSKKKLKKNGFIYFEINQFLHKEVLNLIKKSGFKKIEIKKDINGYFRMVKISL